MILRNAPLPAALLLAALAAGACTAGPDAARAPGKGDSAAARASSPAPAAGDADSASAAVVRGLTDAMGGQKSWDDLPYFRFDFVVVRDGKEAARFRHWWDKKNGRCRVEGPDDKGRTVTAIFNLRDRKGKSFTEGIVDTDSANVANILDMGYQRWVNDSYWIVMPFKLRDPGANLKYAREERSDGGEMYDVLELSFDKGVGLTSGDRYWIYVNQRTHLIDKWDYLLEGTQPPPQSATWEAWTPVGPLKLALAHRFSGRPAMLRFENVATPASMDEAVFTHSRVRG